MRRIATAALLLTAGCAPASPPPAPSAAGDAPPGWTVQRSGTTASLRGVSVVSERVAWASGSGGTVLRTVDGGATWRADTVPGATALDLRDVQAFSADEALVLTAGSPGRVYRTADGGRSWTVVYDDARPAVFFDGMAFWDDRRGIAFSDPVDGAFVVIVTDDGGRSWRAVPRDALPAPLPGEAGFAASGTMVAVHPGGHAWIGTGGGPVRVLRTPDYGRTWAASPVALAEGLPSAGIFSVALRDGRNGVAVGGDYLRERGAGANVAVTADGGATWRVAGESRPAGVREVATYVPGTGGTLVAGGPSGTGWSADDGRTWTEIDTLGIHTLAFVSPTAGFAVGGGGRVARFTGRIPARTETRP
jgi:photosystem II stability/assembly factor-like uncharacterized protein